MKRFWKKTNRGLWLGGILLLLLIVFVVVKEVQFAKEAPEIGARAREAVISLIELNLSPEGAVLDEALSKDDARKKREELESLLLEYWTPDASSDYYLGAGDVRGYYETFLEEDVKVIFYDVDVEVPDSAIAVRGNGTDYAMVSFELSRVSAVFSGAGDALFCGPYYEDTDWGSYDAGVWRGNYRGYADVEMHRVNGEWRVCGMSVYLNLYGKTESVQPTGGEK
ncbi:MAG: hypothetical protein E7643_00895 [Ruminococcaceae bacterium]|nr:hypothetical protein [Oscillospiraceae bacterium]